MQIFLSLFLFGFAVYCVCVQPAGCLCSPATRIADQNRSGAWHEANEGERVDKG